MPKMDLVKIFVIFLGLITGYQFEGVDCYTASSGVNLRELPKNVVKNYPNSVVGNVSVHNPHSIRIDTTLIDGFNSSLTRLKFIAIVHTETALQYPVFVSFLQRHEAIHMQLPIVSTDADGKTLAIYRSASRTLCIAPPDGFENQIVVTVSSGNPRLIGFQINFVAEDNFQVLLGKSVDFTITPASPTFAYFPFQNNTGQNVVIRLWTDNDLCIAVAIQKPKCPVFNSEDVFGLGSKWEIISQKGVIRVDMREFPTGLYIKMILLQEDSLCGKSTSFGLRQKRISVLIENDMAVDISNGDFQIAIGIPLLISLLFGIIFGALYIISYAITRNRMVSCRTQNMNKAAKDLVAVEKFSLSADKELTEPANYGKWTVFVSLIFAIPIVGQTIYNTYDGTGIFGVCSRNDLCSHTLWDLKGFNHIWVNICYLVLGVLFIVVTILKKWAKQKLDEDEGIVFHVGLYYSMGLSLIVKGVLGSAYRFCPSASNVQYDSMYLSVIVAICLLKVFETRRPKSLNIDTCCGILAVILLVSASGIVVERYFTEEVSMWFRIVVAVVHGLVAFYGSVYVIYIGYPMNRLAKVATTKEEMPLQQTVISELRQKQNGTRKEDDNPQDDIFMKTFSDIPRFLLIFPKFWQWKLPVCRPERWIYLCLMLPLNGFLIYYSLEADFALYPLIVLLANFGLNFGYYFAMKMTFGEFGCSWKSIQVFIYLIMAIGFGILSACLYLFNSGEWSSLSQKADCEFFLYYDRHDAYQMLTAHALFFVFMTLLSIDDGVEGIGRDFLLLF